MQVNSNFGIIIDSFDTILANQVKKMQETFSDADNVDSPAYAIAYLQAQGISTLQQSLQTLWNSINADTANGLGLDIISRTVYDFPRQKKKSTIAVRCDVTVETGKTGTLSLGTSLTFLSSPNFTPPKYPYYLATSSSWVDPGNPIAAVLVFQSDDITTAVDANMVDTITIGSDSVNIKTVVKSSVQNWSTAADLGSLDNDEALQIKRRVYMGTLGQTALGIQKAVTLLNIPGLKGIYVQEFVSTLKNGIIVYIDYPTKTFDSSGSPPNFDTSDPNLQKIAQTIYDYKPFGIVSLGTNGADTGDTPFIVTRNFTDSGYISSYLSTVYLNPMNYATAVLTLNLVVTTVASDVPAGQNVFPADKAADPDKVKQELRVLINQYFLSKYRPDDNTFTLADIYSLIQKQYSGVLGFGDSYFVPSTGTKSAYLNRQTGVVFQLTLPTGTALDSFTFTLTVKSS